MIKHASLLMLGTISFLIFVSCASMNFENYSMKGEKLLFESDFSKLPDGINLHQPNHIKLEDGVLHFKAPEGEGLGADLPVFYAEPTRISFMLKLGEDINRPHPLSHINFYTGDGKRYCVNFDSGGIGSFYQLSHEDWGEGFHTDSSLIRNKWYKIDILLSENQMTIFIDGKRKVNTSIPTNLNKAGGLGFECHNEMWIDDVYVSSIQGYEVIKPE